MVVSFFPFYKIYNPPEPVSIIFYIIVSIISCILILFCFFIINHKNINLKINLSLLFFTVGLSIYSFEGYLTLKIKSNDRGTIAKEMNISFDKRSIMEVVKDKRNLGLKAFPNTYPLSFAKTNGFMNNKNNIYPIGTISNSTIIFCNELGYYNNFQSDKYGFNNLNEQFEKSKIDIVIIGDSFAEGACVKSANNIGGILNKKKFNVLNFGKGSSGPLLQLAALTEYAKPFKPKIVLWLSSINDFSNLIDELKSPILSNYLYKKNFSQNLIFKQEIIDNKLNEYVKTGWIQQKIIDEKNIFYGRYIRFIKLSELRKIFNFEPIFKPTPIFEEILIKSKEIVSKWDGKIYFIILPDLEYASYKTNKNKKIYNQQKNLDFINNTVSKLNIRIINLHKNVIDKHPDPLSLFSLRIGSHYNDDGYKLIAEEIFHEINMELMN